MDDPPVFFFVSAADKLHPKPFSGIRKAFALIKFVKENLSRSLPQRGSEPVEQEEATQEEPEDADETAEDKKVEEEEKAEHKEAAAEAPPKDSLPKEEDRKSVV